MNLLTTLFNGKKIKELKQRNQELEEQLTDCSEKLFEKQEHINKTNAYWKKKMHQITNKKGTKK